MRAILNSLISAIIGGAVVFFAASQFVQPPVKTVKEVSDVKTRNVAVVATKTGELTPEAIYENYSGAVVHVRATVRANYNNFFGMPMSRNEVASGSGFIVSKDGYVVTNAHVVQGADSIKIQLSDNAEIAAELVGIDQSTDLAFLKVDFQGHSFKVLTLGISSNVDVGQPVYAIGNPLGLDRSMSGGIVSALNREINAPNGFPIRGVIQTDAAINKGNSGGPLLSSTGKVIGVTAQIATDEGSGNIGIAFAIPSDTVKKVFDEIKQSGKASHPYIGIKGMTLFPELAKALKLDTSDGAMIISVPAGPAQKAGLKGASRTLDIGSTSYEVGGDVITAIGKTKISSMDDLISEISLRRTGDKIELTIVTSENKMRKIELTLEERPDN